MQIAIDRLIAHGDGHHPHSIVYVGDGIWDARACRQLQLPFVGVGAGAHAKKLREEGARAVFPDY